MKKLTLTIPEIEQIEINGEVFDILKTDLDILNRSAEYNSKVSKIDIADKSPQNVAILTALMTDLFNYLDEILGEGAVKKIAKSRPVSLKTAIDWLFAVCEAVRSFKDESVSEYIKNKYE